jgi:RimJ/RimL family protein N-acetyltransferase
MLPPVTDEHSVRLVDGRRIAIAPLGDDGIEATDARTGESVGVARYAVRPDGESAEIAVTVDEAWRDRGVGTLLARRLAERARAAGIRRLEARMRSDDAPMRALMRKLGTPRVDFVGDGDVEATVELRGS